MSKLYKKEEESILNKKKKREEVKQKNKTEKAKTKNNVNGMNQYNNYMGLYMNQMQPMNNQGQGYIDEYKNIYYYPPYQYPTSMIGYNPYFQQYIYEEPQTLDDNINMIYNRGIVNNIIGAFYIQECQEKMKNKEKRKVPIEKVELEEESDNNNLNNNKNNLDKRNNNTYIKEESSSKEENIKENNDKNIIKDNNDQNTSDQNKNDLIKPELIN